MVRSIASLSRAPAIVGLHLAISTNYSDNLIKRRSVPPIMLAAQLSITLSIRAEEYQSRRIEVCLFTWLDNRAAAIDETFADEKEGGGGVKIAVTDFDDYNARLTPLETSSRERKRNERRGFGINVQLIANTRRICTTILATADPVAANRPCHDARCPGDEDRNAPRQTCPRAVETLSAVGGTQ